MYSRHPYQRSARLVTAALSSAAVLIAPTAVIASDLPGNVSGHVSGHVSGGPVVSVQAARNELVDAAREGLAAAPTTPTVREFALRELGETGRTHTTHRAGRARSGLVRTSEPRPVTGYGVVGATWEGPRPGRLLFAVRTRIHDLQWSAWQTLHGGDCPCEYCTNARVAVAAGHGPNVDSAEFARARQGTDAMAVGDVDQVQVRVTSPRGQLPDGLQLSVVDPGRTVTVSDDTSDASSTRVPRAGTDLRQVAATTSGRAPQPGIFTRAEWGANEQMRAGSPSYGTVKAGFVHHTVNANTYTREQVPSILRGIYAYHTQSRGWSDIGYNFLVDRFGRIWEGRYGGMARPVIGAHTLGYNHLSFAMSAIGNFDIAEPPPAVARAYAELFAWKLDLHEVPATSTPTLDGNRLHAISGHRDAGSTACPGRYLYAQLPAIRTTAAEIQAAARTGTPVPPSPTPPSPTPPSPPRPPGPEVARDLDNDGLGDLLVRDRDTGRIQMVAGAPGPGFADPEVMALPAGKVDLIAGVGDLTGDGLPDLLTRVTATGVAQVRPGVPGAHFGRPLEESATTRLRNMDLLAGVGDLTGSGWPDLVGRSSTTGRIWLYRGGAGGVLGTRTPLPIAPTDVRRLTGPGDIDGDSRPDLLVTAPDGRLLLYPGTADGSVGRPTLLGTRWARRDLTVAGVDLTGDGVGDLLTRDRRSGITFVHALRPGGRPGPRLGGGWTTWSDLGQLSVIGDPGTGRARLVGRTNAGALVVLDSHGTGFYGQPSDTGRTLADADYVQAAGDWDGDGHLDALSRSAGTGNVGLHRGTGDGSLGARTRLWAGWTDKQNLVVTGDLTGDEVPDMVARDPDGALYVYPGDGGGGTQPRRLARSHLFPTDLVTAGGLWNDDAVRDLVVRHARSHRLYLVPGTSSGTFGTPVALTSDPLDAYDRVLGVGDHDGDGSPDLVATTPAGSLWLLPGKDDGLLRRRYLGGGMDRVDLLG